MLSYARFHTGRIKGGRISGPLRPIISSRDESSFPHQFLYSKDLPETGPGRDLYTREREHGHRKLKATTLRRVHRQMIFRYLHTRALD